MPKLFHFPWLRRLLNKGVNTDILPELMPDGTAREAINVRPGSITGNAGGAEAIKGEVIEYPVPTGQDPEGYVLIGSCTCNNQLVEFWASSLYDSDPVLYAPIVRVDGVVVAKSKNIPYVWNRPLQIAVADDFFGTSISANEDANGVVRGRGVVYPADHNSIPLYWDIKQLVDFANSGNLGYFGDNYQVGINSVGLFNTPEFPVHSQNYLSGEGLPAGQYQYALRYVTPQGDKTNIGPYTPLITVPLKQDNSPVWEQSHYPGVTTVGGNFEQQTQYGVEIKFRVDNVFGFQSIEVIRKAYNTADNIGNNTVVATIPIAPNQVSVVTFKDPEDSIASDSQETITDEEANIKVMAINKPKSVEYSDRRLTYANFETFPKDVGEVSFIERDGKAIFPITQGVCTRYLDPNYNSNGENPRENEALYTYWNDGYSDPVNNTYLKSFMRGERYGIGVMFWNQFAEQSFVKEVPLDTPEATNDGYLFPNRRDKREGRSFQYSSVYEGVDPRSRKQATTDLSGGYSGSVDYTFEAFSQGGVRKNIPLGIGDNGLPWSGYGFINKIYDGGTNSPFGPEDPLFATASSNTNNVSRLSQSPNGFQFYRNVQLEGGGGQPQYPRLSYVTNGPNADGTEAIVNGVPTQFRTPVTGNIWAPRHYALGAAIEGIQDVPANTTIISVMRTEPAGRVIAQGIGCWKLGENSNEYTKDLNGFNVLIPDFKNGVVDQSIVQNITTSSLGIYKIQLVSPLGFFTEQYSGAARTIPSNQFYSEQWGGADFLSYAGVQWDDGNRVNNGLTINAYKNLSYPSIDYVGYGSWREQLTTAPGSVWSFSGNSGNQLFDISNVNLVNENGQEVYVFYLNQYPYRNQFASKDIFETPNDFDYRNFHEPWYVVNIVKDDAKIPNNSIDKYIETGYHIKVSSCIGITPSASQLAGIYQDFELLNERLGDVYLDQSSTSLPVGDPAANRYVYVELGANVERWLCVTGNAWATNEISTIVSELNQFGQYEMPGGIIIKGVYSIDGTNNWTSSSKKDFTGTVRFGQWISSVGATPESVQVEMPANGSRIIVKYDKNEPIRFFGGECTVSPSLDALNNRTVKWSNIDSDIYTDGIERANEFGLTGFPMPYRRWSKAPGYQVPMSSGLSQRLMENNLIFGPGGKRQWVVYWDAEQRSKVRHYAGNPSSTQGPYEWPRMGYFIRFGGFEAGSGINGYWPPASPVVDGTSVNMFARLNDSYGGFLLVSNVNTNYLQQAPVSGFGVPFVSSGGEFTEKFYFPTGLIASLEFNQLAQDVPSLRTFLELNLKTISEENGEIKTIASALASGGRNLYAWTDNGVARVLTNKNILTGASGELISTQAVSNYWGEEMWISRNIGSPDQMWQMMVKGFAPAGNGYADSFFWPDRNSIYRMVGDSIIDIGREQILSYALPILRSYPRGYVPGISGIYNKKFNEAWMPLLNKNVKKLLVYNPEVNAWNGIYDYSFDGYTQVGNDVFGHRGLQTFKLDQGWTINATARQASVTVPMVADIDSFKEFIRWRVVGSKPDKIQILDPVIDPVTGDFVVMSEMPNPLVSPVNPLWVKEYDGWEGWADRTLASYPPGDRKLPQKRYFYLRVIWNREEDVNATSLSGQLKPIK